MENQHVPVVSSVPGQKQKNRLAAGLVIAAAVLAGGYAAYAYHTHSWPFAPSQPESPIVQAPAGWKSYSNNSMAFSVSYPPTWSVRETGSGGSKYVYLTPPDAPTDGSGSDVSFHVVARDAEQLYKEDLAACTEQGVQLKQKTVLASGPVTAGGITGWRLGCTSSYGGTYQNDYLLIDNKKTLVVSHGFDVALHLQIVSTLNVLGQTNGWRTYTSKQFGFEMKYPSNVELEVVDNNYNFLFSDPGNPSYFFTGITIVLREQFTNPKYHYGPIVGETPDYVAVRQGAEQCPTIDFCAEHADLAARILGTFRFTR